MSAGGRDLTGSQQRDDLSLVKAAGHRVFEVARTFLAELDAEAVFDRVLESARDLTGARYAALGVLDESGTALARFLSAGIDASTRQQIGSLPAGRGVLGELIRNPAPLRLPEVGEHPRSFGFPPGHPPMHTFLGVPILIGGKPFGNLYLTEKENGAEFSQEDEEALVLLAGFAGLAIDHARRYSALEARRGELQRNVDALDATVQIARTLAGQTDLGLVLELIAKRGRDLVSARGLVIELNEGDELIVASGAGELPRGLIGHKLGLKDTVASAALRTRRVQRLDDELNRARFSEHGLGHLGLQTEGGLVVPLVFQDRAYGVLVAVDRLVDGPEFTAQDEALLESFAASAATAVATAHSVAVARRNDRLAAAEQERARWARELHDETLQGLAALRLGLAAGRRTEDPAVLNKVVEQAIGGLESEIADLRSFITELRPVALDELGTEPAIEALRERSERIGLEVDLSIDLAFEQGRKPDRHTPEFELATYRIVQEALTNAGKHGAATRAVVEIIENENTVELSIRDNGRGFDPESPSRGFGLLGMRERAELLGGWLEIDSTPGQGSVIRASLPVQRRGTIYAPAKDRTG
jgi:signal transduction histidine kinase